MSNVDEERKRIIEIRTDHLLKYLQSRQLSLVIGHYRHLHFFGPSQDAIDAFVSEDVTLGSAERGTKVILQNWGLRNDREPFLQRRLHLWSLIPPPPIDDALNQSRPLLSPKAENDSTNSSGLFMSIFSGT